MFSQTTPKLEAPARIASFSQRLAGLSFAMWPWALAFAQLLACVARLSLAVSRFIHQLVH